MEKSGKIVRDNDTRDIFYYRNAFALVTTKVIKECCVCYKQRNWFSWCRPWWERETARNGSEWREMSR